MSNENSAQGENKKNLHEQSGPVNPISHWQLLSWWQVPWPLQVMAASQAGTVENDQFLNLICKAFD